LRRFRYTLYCGLVSLLLGTHEYCDAQSPLVIRPEFNQFTRDRWGVFPHKTLKRPRVALVLSGGGARGVAQVGVLKVLERSNIPIDLIAATSLGAIVGGLYAAGYTAAELETLALTTDWDYVISLTEETTRRDLFVDQKLVSDRSFISLRFEGLEPVLPSAVSSGQRLTDFLSTKTLQGIYHPNPDFDDLKVRFRTVTTDLVSGRRIVLKDGSLAEALRASATVPMLFNALERDGMQLIDGGLVSNIPVDIARSEGADIVIAVNSTSGLRNADELKAPWQTADQIMGIMMQASNEQQLKASDIIITPDIGKHLSSDFRGLDSLIRAGELAAEVELQKLVALYNEKQQSLDSSDGNAVFSVRSVTFAGPGIPDSLRQAITQQAQAGPVSVADIRSNTRALFDIGDFRDVSAEVFIEGEETSVVYRCDQNPTLKTVELSGCNVVPTTVLSKAYTDLIGKPMNVEKMEAAFEGMLRMYRTRGYSLARVDTAYFEEATGALVVTMNEGFIHAVDVQGGVRTQDEFVLREFPLEQGDVFQIGLANEGIRNISSTKLFEYVYLEVSYDGTKPVLTIRLKERPSQLVRFGLRIDNERNLQGLVDIRDENFRGLGTELGLTISGGGENQDIVLEYKAHRLFNTYLTYNIGAFFNSTDIDIYDDDPAARPNRWNRIKTGSYRAQHYGGRLVFGTQIERLGNVTMEYSLLGVRIRSKENADRLVEQERLGIFRIGTVVDTKDRYPFPTSGIGLNISYEVANTAIGSGTGYNALRFSYESYSSWGNRHTFHPRISLGSADKTMPLSQQFSLGGRESFFGVRDYDRRGRQMLLVNLEYRYKLPVRVIFDTYFQARFDAATISAQPEDVKFNTLRYGVGAELALDTPIGPAVFSLGNSFFFSKNLPENPVQWGPLLFYFMIGYQL
jgi:NTE family protein